MNHVTLVGNLTRDPESGTTQSGVQFCRFTVACQRRFKNQNGQYDADFINCTAWRETAEFVKKYFTKGRKIGLEGSITTGSYTANDGSKRYTTEVTVNNVEFVTAKGDGEGGSASAPPAQAAPAAPTDEQMSMDGFTEVEDDDLPF